MKTLGKLLTYSIKLAYTRIISFQPPQSYCKRCTSCCHAQMFNRLDFTKVVLLNDISKFYFLQDGFCD